MESFLQREVSLAPLTTWKIGGPAEWYCAPETEAVLLCALDWARENCHPVQVLGRGSNVLVPDEGIRGLVICLRKLEKDWFEFKDDGEGRGLLTVSAGMSLPRLAKVAAQLGFGGYEFYIGIPGTVGGAVVMNAGFGPGDERQTANRCREIRTVSLDGQSSWQAYSEVQPVYRHTRLVDGNVIATGAKFALTERSTKEKIRAVTAGHLAMRRSRQPLTRPTCGSVFKGTDEGVPAAVFIDRCGLKGLKVGGAVVSFKHANWIENLGGATASDVRRLISHIQAVVFNKEGVQLKTEVCFLG
ncbi:UDP-N-acetylmuramate dehydrogenase [Puniceicoccales bacterium CK1056]|uniref:UDP-N-acetylenolpyruvoylglucosamine reductase n=1 Tax=Oceanipulchritudo coccoides TaxID=2706888 RepID=A0A6B2M2E7_9BACT|nr:UDP-N-acetylmuramate dehydrogenase [Oceanipulchritudo coccoides]NDV62304.1 UDP-N-acetylmuramate dehydrogenase [Oceanipulchritudo coccoides]